MLGPRNFNNRNIGGLNAGIQNPNTNVAANINRTQIGRQGLGWRNPYLGYHQNWMHGYWHGNHPGNYAWNRNYFGWPYYGGLGFGGLGYGGLGYGGLGYGGYGYGGWGNGLWGLGGLGLGLGAGLGWGLSSWAYGPSLYNWGYSNYYNPYYYQSAPAVAGQPVVYDYSQPIDPSVNPPAQPVTDTANTQFDQARSSFKNGDYAQALTLTDQALGQMPNDSALHEFRALTLFALQRYDEAATSLYAVLSIGPGWDWTTMIGLYPSVDAYTNQLRALEAYIRQNPRSASARFVLAYHYLTEGYIEPAVAQLKQAVQLQPKDMISAQLLRQLQAEESQTASGGKTSSPASPVTPPASGTPGSPVPAAPSPAETVPEKDLVGTWTAEPVAGTSINLSFQDEHKFVWKVTRQGKSQEFSGEWTYGDGILTLAQGDTDAAPPMVARLIRHDDGGFGFKLMGSGPEDPGLSFKRST
jgi:tetratricopeptide (TPR) repeat protein